jgi:hypothetical protein
VVIAVSRRLTREQKEEIERFIESATPEQIDMLCMILIKLMDRIEAKRMSELERLMRLTNGLDSQLIWKALENEKFKPLREALEAGLIWYDGRERRWKRVE